MQKLSETVRRPSLGRGLVQFSLCSFLILVADWPAKADELSAPTANIVIKLRDASDPYVWWAWLSGFTRGAADEIEEQVLRLQTGIEILSISDHFGPPLNSRQRAYVRGSDAAHLFIEGLVHEVEMQVQEFHDPGFRQRVTHTHEEVFKRLFDDLQKAARDRPAPQPPVPPTRDD